MSLIRSLQKHKLVLDTHIWLWLVKGEKVFKLSFLKFLSQRSKNQKIYVSPISIWEIGMLTEKKRIQLGMDALEWIESAIERANLTLAPITPRIAVQSTKLPGSSHGDPADRILISTAHENNAVLVTCDKKILKYGRDRYLDVYDPCKTNP